MPDGGDGTGSAGDSPGEDSQPATSGDVDDETVVRTAAEAAEDVVFSRVRRSDVADLDVTVSFEDGLLEVDVYLDVADEAAAGADPERVAEDAALAARGAVDDLLE